MIRTTNLKKVYLTEEIETTALNDVNLEVKEGEVSCKWCKHYIPASQVEDGYFSFCLKDNRKYAEHSMSLQFGNTIAPMSDKFGKNHNKDCPDYERAGWWKRFNMAMCYKLTCPFVG